jgi:hypothetical protein
MKDNKGNSTKVSPAENTGYNYKQDVVKNINIADLKISRDSVPTWSSSDMNEANIKATNSSE